MTIEAIAKYPDGLVVICTSAEFYERKYNSLMPVGWCATHDIGGLWKTGVDYKYSPRRARSYVDFLSNVRYYGIKKIIGNKIVWK